MAGQGAVHSSVAEYEFPHGHVGHLSPEQATALAKFRLLCTEKGCYNPATDDDATLLRFLRARRFNLPSALDQFHAHFTWRQTNVTDEIHNTIDLPHFEETRRLYPQWTGRRDRRGFPVYLYEVKHLTSETMAAYEKSSVETFTYSRADGQAPPKLLRLSALYENFQRFILPLCTLLPDRAHPETPITQNVNIVDISGVGFKQFWDLRAHMQDASKLATAHYPETLDRILIIGAPAFFPTVWGWIKKWFDPYTTSKILIIGPADVQKTLEAFMEPQNIPKQYGGQLDFQHGDRPRLDPALQGLIKWENGWDDFPGGPIYWVDNGDCFEAYRSAGASTSEIKEKICTMPKPTSQD
ncbi:hypothetical protein K3495_g9390 [Podosphaera aphanis]|nr:hypothetical protein K3495_g9390 [Podosphaera aphanis]